MDREAEIIKGFADLIEVIKGMQNTIENMLNVSKLLKERIEKLEQTVECLKEDRKDEKNLL